MRPRIFPTQPVTYILIGTTAFSLVPTAAWPCAYCGLDFVRLTFPFFDSGLIILGIWRMLYAIWQWYVYRPRLRRVVIGLAWRAAVVLYLYMSAFRAGVFVYLVASFIKAAVRMIRYLAGAPIASPRSWRETFRQWMAAVGSSPPGISDSSVRPRPYEPQGRPVPPKQKMALLLLHLSAIVALTPFAVRSYAELERCDDLERFVRYAHAGTAPARAIVHRIAKDPSFDVERLRPMLMSDDFDWQHKAYEILLWRHKVEDISRFLDIFMRLDDNEFVFRTSNVPWLPDWLDGLCGYEKIQSKAELREWLDRNPGTSQPPVKTEE